MLLPEPSRVASPVRAVRLVSELVDSVAYTHGLREVVLEEGWWGRRICTRLGLAECSTEETVEEVVGKAPEILEVDVDGSQPIVPGAAEPRRILQYYVDSRRGGVLFLGARLLAVNA